ncbi:MAG TPA: hypothetical protein VHP37_32210 [Burkholderiales bacterium]|nr:hypothetical protein [Burkholderiales bacterium]
MKRSTLLLGLLLAQASPLFAADAKPTDAAAPVPQTSYRSAFEGYRSATEVSVADWRSLNEEVTAIGGHVGIMRGAAPQPPQAGATSARPAPPAHSGHQH